MPEERRPFTGREEGFGRLDVYGKEWFACDPYPTWYRWEGSKLFTEYRWEGSKLFTEEEPIEWMDGHGS